MTDLSVYREQLARDPDERRWLDENSRIPVSRFYRDRAVFDLIFTELLPGRAEAARREGRESVSVWSTGCAAGEEPYSLVIGWRMTLGARYPELGFRVRATDADPDQLERARRGCYPAGSVRELPQSWREQAFDARGERYCLRSTFAEHVELGCEDLRYAEAAGPFDLVCCRNLAFSYFAPALRRRVAEVLLASLAPGGYLIIGARERLPDGVNAERRAAGVYERPERPAANGRG